MATVYVVHQGDIDFTPAQQYGDLRYITQGYARFDNVKKLSQQIANHLCDSKPTDFLVLSGNNLLCAIVCLMWMKLHGHINILHWAKDSYVIVPLTQENYPIIV
jgi:hypothetical protein